MRVAATIASVRADSPAAQAGIVAGDCLVRVNGKAPRDYIEYRYLIAEETLSLVFQDARGRLRRVRVEKTLDEDLGLRFTEDVFDGIITCRNRCLFCFVSQLPRGLRPALYLRDDDYRLSFLHGNFITLSALTRSDRARIARLHLSPLYVSVHATDPQVRRRLFGGPAGDPLAEMRWLGARGIEFHTQIVVCPGINDGAHLARTISDLAALHPVVRSIGVVPVGLTRRRNGRSPIAPVTRPMAQALLASVRRWQRHFRRGLGARLVFAADELFLSAGEPLPGQAHYEGFPQLGNGIGCARLFLDSVRRLRPPALRRPVSVTLVTGELAAPLVGALADRLGEGDVRARVVVVPNRLFGRSVTVAGLLAGADIVRAMRGGEGGDLAIVPGTAVREGDGFIDGMTLDGLAGRLSRPVVAAATPGEATAALRRFDQRRS